MKKTLFKLFTILGLTAFAQQEAPPQGINYQAVVYVDENNTSQPGINAPGQVLWNQQIGVQFSVLSGSTTGALVYKETHATSTDEFGMFDLVIGQGLVQGTQSFNMIDWGSGYHFLKVEVDKTGGTDYVEMSVQQLWSVPYSLYAQTANTSNYSDSSSYSAVSGNGIIGVADNGDGTLTFTYYDGSTYTTAVLSGLGGVGPQGPAGADGQDGQSAYDSWLSQGNTGTEADFLNGLTGPQGPAGTNGVDGIDGTNGIDGQDGLSAYDIWLAQGNTGTEADFLNSITGPAGSGGFVHFIGEHFGGGVIFHLWKDSSGIEHGLVVDKVEINNIVFSNVTSAIGPSAESSWNGLQNSNAIVSQSGHTNSAAAICLQSANSGYTDWYLPSIDELSLIWQNRFDVNKSLSQSGDTEMKAAYLSSTETAGAIFIHFFEYIPYQSQFEYSSKDNPMWVRAIRAF